MILSLTGYIFDGNIDYDGDGLNIDLVLFQTARIYGGPHRGKFDMLEKSNERAQNIIWLIPQL